MYWMTDASMKSFLPSAYFSGLSVLLCACQSRPPEIGSPASAVIARSMSWVDREFISTSSTGLG